MRVSAPVKTVLSLGAEIAATLPMVCTPFGGQQAVEVQQLLLPILQLLERSLFLILCEQVQEAEEIRSLKDLDYLSSRQAQGSFLASWD